MNRLVLSGIISLCLVASPHINIAGKKKPADVRKETSKYEQLINQEGCIAAKGDFISLYNVNETLYMELPLKYLGRDFLISTAITKTTDVGRNSVGNKINQPLHGKFTLENGYIYIREINSAIVYDKTDAMLAKAIEATYMERYIGKYKIEAYNDDRTAVVINVTDLFVGNKKEISPVPSYQLADLKATFNPELSRLGQIKAFSDNAMVKSILSYNTPNQEARFSQKSVWTIETTRSILLLPEEPMKPRLSDSRIGLFLLELTGIDFSEGDKLTNFAYATRWRLDPKDPDAWARGELVEPVKPIVFYVDNSFPEVWKRGIKRGILAWNDAYAKIGFKNVMHALDFPTDDPDFDPDNLKYSCIRYVPNEVASARGPSWIDPRSGEIINGCVMVWGNLNSSMSMRRFIETAHLDPRVRKVKMPDDITEHSLFDIMAHEIGHTIGLAHNMAGSAYPVDSLRSATFTKEYGVTASIMDYIHYNYIAQPEDKGVQLYQSKVGVYDELCIKYVYNPIPGNLSVKEEAAIAEKWIDEKAGDPMYKYGVQQWNPVYDPSTLINDLGDDPVKAGNYGIKNLKYTFSNLLNWFPHPETTPHLYELYNGIVEKYGTYIKYVTHNVGGIYLSRVKPGTTGDIFKAVPKDVQKQSVAWVINELKNSNWIDDKELTSRFNLGLNKSVNVQMEGIKDLLSTADNIVLSSHISDDPYTLSMYFDDLYKGIWDATINNKKLSEADKIMQRMFINTLYAETESTAGSKKVFDQIAMNGEQDSNLNLFSRLEAETSYSLLPGYGSQRRINVNPISEKKGYCQITLEKIKKLIESKVKTAHAEDIAHYKTILSALNI